MRRPLSTIMHFLHDMGSWKNFGLIGNALLYLFSGYIYFFINFPEQRILNFEGLKDGKTENIEVKCFSIK